VAFRSKVVSEANREYLNPAAFAQVTANCPGYPSAVSAATCPQLGTQGNAGRNAFRGIPAYNVDAQVSRIFPIHERLNLDLRLESFNVLNHPNFSNPAIVLNTISTFGQVSGSSAARVFQGSVKLYF